MAKTKKKDGDTAEAAAEQGSMKHEAVRLDDALRSRIGVEEGRLRAANPTLRITRSDTLRTLIIRGLDASPSVGSGGPVAVKGEV